MLKEGELSFYTEADVLLVAPCTFFVVAATKVQETVVVVLQVLLFPSPQVRRDG